MKKKEAPPICFGFYHYPSTPMNECVKCKNKRKCKKIEADKIQKEKAS